MYRQYVIWMVMGLFLGCQERPLQEIEPARSVPNLQPLSGGKVIWRSWAGRDSARIVNKPILLFMYNQRSFWCRDMAQRCFNNDELAREIMRIAWPVWVDVDREVDVFNRFGLGALPSVACLMPREEWIAGGTYFDPEDLMDLLRRVSFPFANPERMINLDVQRTELQRRARVWQQKNPRPPLQLSKNLYIRVLDSLQAAPHRGIDVGAEGLLALFEARQSVVGISHGVKRRRDTDGAFFLHAYTSDGKVVDREKHLGVNASFLMALSLAGQKQDTLGVAAEKLGQTLLQDFKIGSLFCAGFAGFDTQKGVPRDPSIYAGWNALAVSGFMALSGRSQNLHYQDVALLTFEAIENHFGHNSGLFFHTLGDDSTFFLQDQAFVARAALDIFEKTGQEKYLQVAVKLADGMMSRFADASGALRDREYQEDPVFRFGDGWLPSGNGVAAQVLVRLGQETGEKRYHEMAQRILRTLIGPHIDDAASMGALCRALGMYLNVQ